MRGGKRCEQTQAWGFNLGLRHQAQGLLPRPLYLRFDAERENDVCVTMLEALLDRGVVPLELIEGRTYANTIDEAIRQYLFAVSVPAADRALPKRHASYNNAEQRSVRAMRRPVPTDRARDRRFAPEEEQRIRAILAGDKPPGPERAFQL